MKLYNKIAIAFSLIVVILLIFIVVNSIATNEKVDLREKTISEIKYFESKLVKMYNLLNNIEFENYQISISDVSEKSKKSSDNEEKEKNNEGSGENNNSEGDKQDETSQSESSSNKQEEDASSSDKKDKKYSLNFKGVLSDNGIIKWDSIKTDAEILENSISSMMLDLYELSIENIDIANFTKEYDSMLVNIKNEDKEKTLNSLNAIYSYFPKFLKICSQDKQYETIISTKQKIFLAYSILDLNDWNNIEKYLNDANDIYSELLNDISTNKKNQYIINKCYLTLNGLKNSAVLKDKEIFLIKYKNLLEDFNSL